MVIIKIIAAAMLILDNLAKVAKDFFIDDEHSSGPGGATSLPVPAASASTPGNPTVTQPEQRHLDHIASLLTGDGHDFTAYTKMVRSMASSGMTGPLLYKRPSTPLPPSPAMTCPPC